MSLLEVVNLHRWFWGYTHGTVSLIMLGPNSRDHPSYAQNQHLGILASNKLEIIFSTMCAYIFIWTHGKEALELLKSHVNSFHPSIKSTLQVSSNRIPFLDVLVKLNTGTLSIPLYCKPTDKHLFKFESSSSLRWFVSVIALWHQKRKDMKSKSGRTGRHSFSSYRMQQNLSMCKCLSKQKRWTKDFR